VLRVALVYPELLGTYGDGGNALVLGERAKRRGIEVDVVRVGLAEEIPEATIYLLGGGEDGPQRLGADLLRGSSFGARVRDGAYVFAVCAGLQLLGTSFAVEGDDEYEGLGLVRAVTRRGLVRSVGELLVQRDRATYAHGPVLALNPWLADEILSTILGEPLEPLASVADDLYAERRSALLHSSGS